MPSANSITVAALDLIKAAMQEIGALASGENPSAEDESWVLQKLQRLFDRYNARRPMVYNVSFTRFTLQANHTPHTIGPGADFDVNQRPVSIDNISLILTGTGNTEVEIPLNSRDDAWWAAQTIKNLSSTLPTDFYYSPDWPNGNLYFWPVPTAVNDVRIESRAVLSEITSYSQNFSLPPGYWDLTVWDLACDIAPSFERPVTPDMRDSRQRALKAVQTNNISSPRLASDAPSQSSGNRARPDFNYLTGLSR